jgi:asparagine synthase (glutamine-hydrolysing)
MTQSSETHQAEEPARSRVWGNPTCEGKYISTQDLAERFSRLSGHELETELCKLRGAFALAIELEDGSKLLAVDRFGQRSICWRVLAGSICANPRADLLADLKPASDIDVQALYDYLHFHVIPSPRTVFSGVHRVEAGHYLIWRGGRASVARYWHPHFEEPKSGSLTLLQDEFRILLRTSVRRQLDKGEPACYLSGGTDSSTVAGLIAEISGMKPLGYSIGFEAEGYDEMSFARIAAQHFGVRHREYYVTPDDLVRSMPVVAAHYDQPFGNSSAVPAYLCAMQASKDGVTHLLAGDGGDELFGGNARYAKQRLFELYRHIPSLIRSGAIEPLFLHSRASRLPIARKISSYIEQARVPMPDRLELYNLLHRLGPQTMLPAKALEFMDPSDPLEQQRRVWAECQPEEWLNRTLAFDWRYTLAESDLPKVVGSADLAGLSVGFPLLDEDLLAFSMKLPSEFKLKGQQLRWFFKEALKGFLPDEIITKPKHGFGLPFGPWLIREPILRCLAEDALSQLVRRGLIRPDFVSSLMNERLPSHPGYYGELVWILTMLEFWLRARRPEFRIQ